MVAAAGVRLGSVAAHSCMAVVCERAPRETQTAAVARDPPQPPLPTTRMHVWLRSKPHGLVRSAH